MMESKSDLEIPPFVGLFETIIRRQIYIGSVHSECDAGYPHVGTMVILSP